MNKKIVGIAILLLVVVGAGGAGIWFAGIEPPRYWPFRRSSVLRLPGIVEIQEVRLGSKVGGRVAKVLVNEGAVVSPGQPLVLFEAPELENQRKQLQARLEAAEAEWLRAVHGPRAEEKRTVQAAAEAAKARYLRAFHGPRPEEKEQAKSDLESAEAEYEQTLKEWNRLDALFRRQAISRTDYDAALATRDRAKGRVDSARARAMMMKRSRQEDVDEAKAEWQRTQAQQELLGYTRWEDVAIARAKVDELQATMEAIDINLRETTVYVPQNLGKAVVEVVAIRPGDLVPANQSVVRVLRVEDLWVKIFVPETVYGLVKLGQKVEVTIDSYPGKTFQGEVMQRANISEFTPRNVQSLDERQHQVFGVKIQVVDPQGVFNAGMAAEVTIPRD